MIAGHAFELSTGPVGQPVIVEVTAEPATPFALERHPSPDRCNSDCQTGGGKRSEVKRLSPQQDCVALADGVEKIAAPEVDAILDNELQHDRADQQYAQQQGPPI
jgi:hypothetical protein